MLRDWGVSSVWECCSKDTSPFLLGCPLLLRSGNFVSYGLQRDVVAALGLVLEKLLSVHVLTTPRRLPILLLIILTSHPLETISTHEVVVGVSSRNGKNRTLRPSKDHSTKRKRSRTRLQLVLCDDWHGNTGCLVAQDLALLTKVRSLIHEEISLLTVLYFPFRARTPSSGLQISKSMCQLLGVGERCEGPDVSTSETRRFLEQTAY
jgi:hypothetical protein